MDVTNINSDNVATSVGTLVDNAQQQQPPVAKSERPPVGNQSSTEVKLSEKAQQLNRTETSAKETVTPPNPQPVEANPKGSHVNTHA
jgi:hypothetical protein